MPADCFLTTACVDMMGKPDNCMELTTLRNFRDTMLTGMDGGKELIEEYYAIAPGIVKAINNRQERKQVYAGIYTEMILPVIDHIQNNKYSDAVDLYKNYTLSLKTKYAS